MKPLNQGASSISVSTPMILPLHAHLKKIDFLAVIRQNLYETWFLQNAVNKYAGNNRLENGLNVHSVLPVQQRSV